VKAVIAAARSPVDVWSPGCRKLVHVSEDVSGQWVPGSSRAHWGPTPLAGLARFALWKSYVRRRGVVQVTWGAVPSAVEGHSARSPGTRCARGRPPSPRSLHLQGLTWGLRRPPRSNRARAAGAAAPPAALWWDREEAAGGRPEATRACHPCASPTVRPAGYTELSERVWRASLHRAGPASPAPPRPGHAHRPRACPPPATMTPPPPCSTQSSSPREVCLPRSHSQRTRVAEYQVPAAATHGGPGPPQPTVSPLHLGPA
jgi:hypothetical protein